MPTKHAVFDLAQFKALDANGADKGRFEALVSVFGNVDKIGDRVVKGAFAESLADWRAKGTPVPIIWNHQWGDPNAHIGYADPNDITEIDEGLLVKGALDLDNPFAAQVYRLLNERRVTDFSIGYEVHRERKAQDGANELVKLGLFETGPTLRAINPSAQLLDVKAELEAATKAGRRISRATQSEITAALDDWERVGNRLRSLLAPAGEDDDPTDDEKSAEAAQTDGDAKAQTDGDAGLTDEHLDLVTRIAVMEKETE